MQINKSYRRNLHTVEKDYIPQGIIDAENRKKTWKYGFNHGYDMVVISKDGTIGEIVNIKNVSTILCEIFSLNIINVCSFEISLYLFSKIMYSS